MIFAEVDPPGPSALSLGEDASVVGARHTLGENIAPKTGSDFLRRGADPIDLLRNESEVVVETRQFLADFPLITGDQFDHTVFGLDEQSSHNEA